jgi:hypothetical protein
MCSESSAFYPVFSLSSCLTLVFRNSSSLLPCIPAILLHLPAFFSFSSCFLCSQSLFLPTVHLYSGSLPAFYPVFSLSSCRTLVIRISFCLSSCIMSLLLSLPAVFNLSSCRSPVFRISTLFYPCIQSLFLSFPFPLYSTPNPTFLLPASDDYCPSSVCFLDSSFSLSSLFFSGTIFCLFFHLCLSCLFLSIPSNFLLLSLLNFSIDPLYEYIVPLSISTVPFPCTVKWVQRTLLDLLMNICRLFVSHRTWDIYIKII